LICDRFFTAPLRALSPAGLLTGTLLPFEKARAKRARDKASDWLPPIVPTSWNTMKILRVSVCSNRSQNAGSDAAEQETTLDRRGRRKADGAGVGSPIDHLDCCGDEAFQGCCSEQAVDSSPTLS